LETYFKTASVTKILDANPDIKIFLDSGAHSLVNTNTTSPGKVEVDEEGNEEVTLTPEQFEQLSINDKIQIASKRVPSSGPRWRSVTKLGSAKTGVMRRFIDYSYNDSETMKKYFEDYIAFVNKYKSQLLTYVNLDVIFNPEKSWENQKYMESCGLTPLPVYHFGEDQKWLKKYMDEYDYIGIGGLGQDITKDKFIATFGDATFNFIRASKQNIKTHGFAVTSLEVMLRYEWYSTDSTSWIKLAAYGKIIIPGFNAVTGELDYSLQPAVISISDVGKKNKGNTVYYKYKYSGRELEAMNKYIESLGVDLAKVETSHFERCKANIEYFLRLQKYVSTDHVITTTQRRTFF
jgi:hypothetical protein